MSTPEQMHPEQMRPEQMRTAVARYVEEIHRAYVAQALTFPAAVRGRMPLLAPGPLTVAAVGARNLHVLATRDSLGPVRGPEVELPFSRNDSISPSSPTTILVNCRLYPASKPPVKALGLMLWVPAAVMAVVLVAAK